MNQQSVAAPAKMTRTTGYAWVVLFAVYIATFAAPLNQMKVPPLMPILREAFHLGYSGAGMLMSIFSILGFVLAIPAGFILQRIGIKMTSLTAVGAVFVGAAAGALSESTTMLFAGRFIEGAGMGLIMVAAPAAISVWFPPHRRGLPMGIWATGVGVGNIATLNFAPALAASHGWRAVWWAGTIFSAAAFILFLILFRLPRQEEMPAEELPDHRDREGADLPALGTALSNRSIWLISIEFMVFNVVLMGLSSFYPDFLNTVRKYSLPSASFVTSIMMAVSMFSGPFGGYVSDRIGKRKILTVVPFIFLALLFLFPFTVTGWMIPVILIAAGLVAGPVAPLILAAVPEIMPSPRSVGIGLGIVILGQNIGMLIGPALFGRLVEITGWATAGYLMIPICLIGIIAGFFAKTR